MESYFVYVTAKDEAEAKAIARPGVAERLAACANILGGIQSIYQWKGEICEDAEVALILKTTAERKDALVARIRGLHSYETPCIVCLPIAGGNPAFLHWLARETEWNFRTHDREHGSD